MAISQTISSFPTAPSREDDTPTEFSTHVDAYLSAVVSHVTEVNTWATQANALATTVNSDATNAATSETNAEASENAAAASANYVGEWGDQTGAANVPYCVSHNGLYWQLSSNLADVTAKEPGVDSEWLAIYLSVVELVKTQAASPYSVTASDLYGNKVFVNTGATGETEFQLPAGAAGYGFEFCVTAVQYLKMTANGTETFRYGGTQGAAGGYIRSNTVGRCGQVKWIGSEWVIMYLNGACNMDE